MPEPGLDRAANLFGALCLVVADRMADATAAAAEQVGGPVQARLGHVQPIS